MTNATKTIVCAVAALLVGLALLVPRAALDR
jgi:hypothetical protein